MRVRRAINMAIDRDALWAGTMEGTGEPAWLPVPSQHWAYSEDLVPSFEYDPEGAKALLEEAGYGDGFTLHLTSGAQSDAVRRGEIVQAQLAEIGITVEITPEQTVDSVQSYFTDKRMDGLQHVDDITARSVDHVPDDLLGELVLQHGRHVAGGLRGPARRGQGGPDAWRTARPPSRPSTPPWSRTPCGCRWCTRRASPPTRRTFAGFEPSLIGKADFLTVHQAG